MSGQTEMMRYVANGVHECAPDHSVETVTVGSLRKWSEAGEDMADALEVCRHILSDRRIVCRLIDAALAKARGEQ